uniref:Uncharacterized protein n=1 Tax=Chromera velia CCMP2878 TaxID=1169474 RepID=A0A0G4FA33_9ALVE|mmetsp:Transcript_5495/g.10891  ORF Transcript_5495/g.10891 Transcript_5495/m.10891 type:complete len:244 (-) Transcript_5495:642-1373(-)|eukprot:Cvel_15820.t1-p1 / transcript=Cvel_15820.t1 / gene=Cvel_15820 / organism=Chromera_velia_CCMP2878 / gene_product=hypothetical protein / transcript_product=hypothetical protein / location=Cvel_scaffold1188:36766-38015(+) / protein_length=243 / sequence_SO=supercontig / SO=protein_coding / is_pseudo=false
MKFSAVALAFVAASEAAVDFSKLGDLPDFGKFDLGSLFGEKEDFVKGGKCKPITIAEIEEAQNGWGWGLVAIGAAYAEAFNTLPNSNTTFVTKAEQVISEFYNYGKSNVLFKPTLTTPPNQFRPTFQGALSYFVGPWAPEPIDGDPGFALGPDCGMQTPPLQEPCPWVDVRFENNGTLLFKDTALAMGNYFFTPGNGTQDGAPSMVEYSFAYVKDPKTCYLKIVLQHSSVPFMAPDAASMMGR